MFDNWVSRACYHGRLARLYTGRVGERGLSWAALKGVKILWARVYSIQQDMFILLKVPTFATRHAQPLKYDRAAIHTSSPPWASLVSITANAPISTSPSNRPHQKGHHPFPPPFPCSFPSPATTAATTSTPFFFFSSAAALRASTWFSSCAISATHAREHKTTQHH